MREGVLILDHLKGVALDQANPPLNNYQALYSSMVGLKHLADIVRFYEIQITEELPDQVMMFMGGAPPPLIECAFNWFSTTLVNYLRLVALIDIMNANGWTSSHLEQYGKQIKSHCTSYVKDVIPEVYAWRNKVAAHYAATDPFRDDNIATLEQTIMDPVGYWRPYYYVGIGKWCKGNASSTLPKWAVTEVYESLRERFWPDMELASLPNS